MAISSAAIAGESAPANWRLSQLFNRPSPPANIDEEPSVRGGPSNSDLVVRLDRLERLNRELTGQIEQLQFQLRKLEEQVRSGAPASGGAPAPAAPAGNPVPPVENGRLRRGDAFDPTQNPGAPGAPRQLGTTLPSAPLQSGPLQSATANSAGGRDSGEAGAMKPLDLGAPRAAPPADTQVAAAPPQGPREEYERAANLLKLGQYDNAQRDFEGFIARHAKTRYMPDAVFGLAETYFQRGRHREAAEQYLKISTDYANSSRGPEAMLRLGQSLNALGAKEQACASFAEVARKYPSASTTIRAAEREAKKISC
ncbi:MAG: tol-pal system protein YbgF [Rhodoblastus sp.]